MEEEMHILRILKGCEKIDLEELLDAPVNENAKSFTQLLREGVPHKGGLAQLAAAEQAGILFSTGETQDIPLKEDSESDG